MDNIATRMIAERDIEVLTVSTSEPPHVAENGRTLSDVGAWSLIVALQKYVRTYADWSALQEGILRFPDRK